MDVLNVVLFGVGTNAKRAMGYLKQKYNILWCVDNDKGKWGSMFFGYSVKSAMSLKNFDGLIIVIAENFTYEIVEQLEDMNIDRSRIMSLFCTVSDGMYSCDVYPIIKKDFNINRKKLSDYDLLNNEESCTFKKKILIFARFYSVYTKQLIENIHNSYDDVELSLLTADLENKKCIQNDCIAHIYYFETMNDLYNILYKLPQYDIAQLLWIENIWVYFSEEIREKFVKLNLCVGGSDFYRASKQNLEFKRKLIELADLVTAETTETIREFSKYYNIDSDKIRLLPFGLEVINYIKEVNDSNSQIRAKFNIPLDRVIVTCGHNAVKEHQHLKLIECLKGISEKVKNKVVFVFPMTYPTNRDDYINEVRTKLEEYELPFVIIKEFMDFKSMGEYAIISDLMIHVQTTDQLSSTMLEEMYAGSVVIAGDWLPYSMLHDRGLYFLDAHSIQDAVNKMEEVVLEINSFRDRCKINRDIIWKYHSWEALISQWHGIWK